MLSDLDVLVVDCQASGATPAHGDLLEIGWAITRQDALATPIRAHWVAPSPGRYVSRIVRKLTGWDETCTADSIAPFDAWTLLRSEADRARDPKRGSIPTVIHFARFEVPFLRALHSNSADDDGFPLETICLHAIAERLFPDLPRRNLRALAGFLGHSPELALRAAGHVDASAFIWRALVPRLGAAGIRTWEDLIAWIDETPASRGRGKKKGFPLSVERRRALPDAPGVYRFVRRAGDVLYVGKATSLKKRVASHYVGSGGTDRSLEMLTQGHDIVVTETASVLEAALLEADEIKRLDPPYNVHLRAGDRHAWFASRDWRSLVTSPDDAHPVGPFPSRGSLLGLAAVRALLEGEEPHDHVRAAATGVPRAFAPDRPLFEATWREFAGAELAGSACARTRILDASKRIVPSESDPDEPDDAPWDPAAVRRHLERTVANGGALVRRATWLSLLADSLVAFREPNAARARLLRVVDGEIIERKDAQDVTEIDAADETPTRSRRERQASFDATRYDRLRVLATELRRIATTRGAAHVRIGRRSVIRSP